MDDTDNIYTASFNFDDEWEGFAKSVIMQNGQEFAFALLGHDNRCQIPARVIHSGTLYIGVQGYKDGKVLTTKEADSGYDDLEAFVAATAVNPVLAGCVKLKDVNNIFGQGENIWVRVWYCYQNFYGSEWGCEGMIILSRTTNVKVGFITGKKGEGFSLTWGTWS